MDTFAVLGGVPHYLISVDREASLMQNEEIARAHLYTVTARGEIPVQIEEVGSWWSRDTQIDEDIVDI